MKEILPAILPEDFSELQQKTTLVAGVAKTVHLDVCDGVFVPRLSWPLATPSDSDFKKILMQEEGLPHWRELDYEAHLMTQQSDVESWITAGAMRMVVHVEAVKDAAQIISAVDGRVELFLALKFETNLDAAAPHIESVQGLQLMSISKIGFQGSKFESGVVEKIRKAKKLFPNILISVDGGVSLQNARELLDAGADRLIVGSGIFASDDVHGTLRSFNDIALSYQ